MWYDNFINYIDIVGPKRFFLSRILYLCKEGKMPLYCIWCLNGDVIRKIFTWLWLEQRNRSLFPASIDKFVTWTNVSDFERRICFQYNYGLLFQICRKSDKIVLLANYWVFYQQSNTITSIRTHKCVEHFGSRKAARPRFNQIVHGKRTYVICPQHL